ncbi:hypothetical protein DCAR_0100994 [Daucus carota subsp. sativus]|uniref:Uncharacterized protein n=1 Tax=Daucus carota subsp. sativus TaxID=79200 RepID=A0A162A5P3_DAUCS|nr:hypothetical protein DCAR_0100994 [Daucus carota subsp. sativus]
MHQNSSQNHNSKLHMHKHITSAPNNHVSRQPHTQNAKPTVNAPKSVLVDPSDLSKLDNMLLNVEPGMIIYVPQNGVVHNMFLYAKGKNMIFYRGQNYFVHLIGEFYGNMVVQKGIDDVLKISTVVHNKKMFVNVNTLNRCLKLGENVPFQLCINIYEKFVFDKKEFESLVGYFCDSDVPLDLCDKNCAIELHHFTLLYQQLAIIIRSNMLPKPKNTQFFDFVDLKVMFQLATNQVEFNINYVILINMIMAFEVEYMPYGLLLTSLFELYHIAMPRVLAERIEYCDISSLVKHQVSLSDCKPLTVTPVCITPDVIFIGSKQGDNRANAEFDKLKEEVNNLKEINLFIMARLDQLENKSKEDSTVGNVEGINEKMDRLFNEDMVNEMAEKSDKLVVDDTGKTEAVVLPSLNDLANDLGFVDVDGPEKA